MSNSVSKDLKQMVHPFIFVLKEGPEIREDFFDYSLMILQMNCGETIKSPTALTEMLPPIPYAEVPTVPSPDFELSARGASPMPPS